MFQPLTQTQQARIDTAESLVAEQIKKAINLLEEMFPDGAQRNSPELLAAVIQAMASSYAATVAVDRS